MYTEVNTRCAFIYINMHSKCNLTIEIGNPNPKLNIGEMFRPIDRVINCIYIESANQNIIKYKKDQDDNINLHSNIPC